jgi:hypothetical protein
MLGRPLFVAGTGFEPVPGGYEPPGVPFPYPAKLLCKQLTKDASFEILPKTSPKIQSSLGFLSLIAAWFGVISTVMQQ